MASSRDPLLQPYQLKHLTLKNRVMSTAHEPAYSEDGMPKERYRLYHVEKAKGGMALTMTAGSADRLARQPARLRQSARLSRRDRAVADEARRRLSRARRSGDDPAHPSRPPHRLEQGRLAAGARRPRRSANRPTAPFRRRRGLGHRAHRRGLCRRRSAHAGGRARRHRIRGLRPSDGRLLVARHQPSRRRVRRFARQPPALLEHGDWTRCARPSDRISSSASAWSPTRTGRKGLSTRGRRRDRQPAGRFRAGSTSSTSSAAISITTRR